jgi:uncharacterized protein
MATTDSTSGQARPLPPSDRIPTLDIVRGFALLGILIMNMPGFTNSFFVEADGSHLWTSPIDQNAEVLRDMLFSGKFNSMFSLLFGLGFTIQFGRMQAADPAHATMLYLRRIFALLAFGLVHAMVFWAGDVLHMYALLGLVLLLGLHRASDRTIVVLIVLSLVYPAVSGSLRLLLITPEITAQLVAEAKVWEASNNLAYGQGSFIDAAREHAREFIYAYDNRWSLWGNLGGYVLFMTTMLIGVLAGRHRWARRVPQLLPQIRRLQGLALVLGVACALGFGALSDVIRVPGPSPLKIVASLCYVLCRVSLMIFYVLTIVRLAQQPAWARRFAPIAAAGRMPLSNYLLQTLLCTALFYGWGAGWWGQVGPAAGMALAVAIFFVIQVPLSLWWLRYFQQGPMEALWRVLTYGTAGRQAARRVSASG